MSEDLDADLDLDEDLDFGVDFDFDFADVLPDPVLRAIIAWKSAAVTLTAGRAAPRTGASGDNICIPPPAAAAALPELAPTLAPTLAAFEPASLDRVVLLLLLDPGRDEPLPPRLVGREPAREPARDPLLPFRFGLLLLGGEEGEDWNGRE